MSFETNKFNVVKKKKLEKSTFNVECNVENSVEIDKILSVCHTSQADSAEILNGVVNYVGYIDLCIVYLTVDGEIGTINASCPFTSKFEDNMIMVGDKVCISVEVEDYSVESVTSSNIKISCACEQSAMLVLSRGVETILTGDDDICLKTDEILVNTLVGEAKDMFTIESNFSIKEPIRKIISSDSQVCVKAVESGVNFVSVSGEVVTRLLYLTENDRFETSYVTDNFKEEVELEGVTRESVSEAMTTVRKSSVKCEIETAEKGVEVRVIVPIDVKVVAYTEKSETVIKDIYSTKCELEVSTISFEMSKQLASEFYEEKIDGTLTLDDNKPRVDKIMFVGGSNIVVTNSYVKEGEFFVEGVTKTNVIYLNDETNSLHSVVVEVPFVVSDKTDAEDGAQVSVKVALIDVDVVVKKGREFYFDAKLKIIAEFSCDEIGAVISTVETAGEFGERDCAIELVFAHAGQTAWDVAKSIKVKEENVIYQNPDLVFPLEKDENIVVFHKAQSFDSQGENV
ncbi:MAG: DUF3794 domain-containing protein [Clostridia bacterium]|nr:DUF3794 domain-containing protein [Clostridia bacterium]